MLKELLKKLKREPFRGNTAVCIDCYNYSPETAADMIASAILFPVEPTIVINDYDMLIVVADIDPEYHADYFREMRSVVERVLGEGMSYSGFDGTRWKKSRYEVPNAELDVSGKNLEIWFDPFYRMTVKPAIV